MKITGDDLRRLRIKQGFTQELLAKKLGVSRKTLHNWESDKGEPTINQFFKGCAICNIDPRVLITHIANRKTPTAPIETAGISGAIVDLSRFD